MSRAVHSVSGLAISLCLSLSLVGEADAIPYNFTKIADSNGSFSNFGDSAINDSGTVVFMAEEGIFTGSGGSTTTIARARTGSFFDFNGVAINNSGTVAFGADLFTGSNGIFTSSNGEITTIATTVSNLEFTGLPGTINDSGTVSFGTFQGIFTGNGGSLTTIADTSGSYSGFFPLYSPINNSGTVAFQANLDAGGSAVFTSSGGATTTIASTSSGDPYGYPTAINNNGTAALVGDTSIFTGNGGSLTTIADTSGSFRGFSNPAINDSGTVAFAARLDEGTLGVRADGIYTGPDPTADKVIAVGDSLFGSTVTNVFLSPDALNNSGQISLLAALTDSEGNTVSTILRADPVPEPFSILGILALGAFGVVSRLRNKNS